MKKDVITKAAAYALIFVLVVVSVAVFGDFEKDTVAEAQLIRQGSTGATVKEIQRRLKAWGYYTGAVDGIFGPKTEAAVRYFQRKNGLAVDGIVGKQTAAAIGVPLHNSGYNSANLNLLARCVYAEARGEPYTGQVAVAAVVLNRVKDSRFPNTISGVIYQPYAFTAVADGQINLTPDATATRAAQDALNGWDPTYGCLFYYNPATATNAWIRSKEVRLTIGKHVFCV
ncbi:MAG: spore cortex-lytic enzyme [Christensenellales bacterium]|jgi:N-acetylmuramoyl-L-alanine amidase